MSPIGTTVLRYVAIWLGVVAATATLSWGAISLALREARLGSDPAISRITPPVTVSKVPDLPARPSPRPSPTPHSSSPSPTRSGSTSVPPPTQSTRPTSTPPPKPSRPTTSRPVLHEASVVTKAGTIVATCESGRAKAKAVVPRDGWAFRIKSEEEVQVKFTRPGADEVEVKIRCSGGRPVFEND